MSEYQYYEFQAIDRRLTATEMETLRAYSTRARISSTSFVNEYHWGGFKGDVDAWMRRFFDAFLYFANGGTRTLKLRLPEHALEPATVCDYFNGDISSLRRDRGFLILTFESECDDGDETWDFDGAGLLSSMIPLRAELARGDLRALYLAWLAGLHYADLDEDAIEPPVPAGLGELSGSLAALAEFLRVDHDLLEVAARASAPQAASPLHRVDVRAWVGTLKPAEKDEILTQLIIAPEGFASVPAGLLQRFLKARDASHPARSRSHNSRRTVGELLRETEQRAAQRMHAAAQKAAEENTRREAETAAARARHLERLAGEEPRLWAEVERLATIKLPKSYDQTVVHLVDLRDLATRAGGGADFATQLARFRATHARKPSLLDRLNRGGL